MLNMKKYPQVLLCYAIAKQAHKGQYDKAGEPYIGHCLEVASAMSEPDLAAAALIHDVFEDTDFTPTALAKYGVSPDIIRIAEVLTRDKSEKYEDYIKRVGANPKARKIKIADLKHNMDLNRLPEVRQKDMDRVVKRYQPAYEYLTALENQKEKGEDDAR